jgi:glycosyltransferase-like protein
MTAKTPLRIALLTHSVNPRGGVVHVLELADALVGRGHAVTVFAPALPGTSFFRSTAAKTQMIPIADVSRDLASLTKQRVAAYVAHLQPIARDFDILHAHDGISGFALAKLSAAEVISQFIRTVHHLDDFEDPFLNDAQHHSVSYAAMVLCVSNMWADRIRETFAKEPEVVPNGVNPVRFHPAIQPGESALVETVVNSRAYPLILCVGGVEKRKNSIRSLRAFLDARRELPSTAVLLIAGGASLLDHSDYQREFQAMLAAADNPKAVRVIGPVADEMMPALYRRADVLLFPSTVEGFGLAVLEAMASHTPVITSRIAPFTEYLCDEDALLVDPFNVAEIKSAIVKSLDPLVRQTLIARGKAVVRRFPWSRSAELHEKVYRNTVSCRGGSHARNAL